jgi:hypothetical protein
MRRTDQALVHGGCGLHGNEVIHEGLGHTAAQLAEGLGQYKVGLRRIDLVGSEATGIHNGKVGPQAMADILIGGTQFMLEQLQGAQDADRNGSSTTGGLFRKPLVETLLDGADQRRPGKGVSPLTDGMHDGHKISALAGGLRYRPTNAGDNEQSASPTLLLKGGTRAAGYDETSSFTSPNERGKKPVTTKYTLFQVWHSRTGEASTNQYEHALWTGMRLCACLFSVHDTSGAGMRAFTDFRGRVRQTARVMGAEELELQGIAVTNPRIEQMLLRQGFTRRMVEIPEALGGGGSVEVFSKVFRIFV